MSATLEFKDYYAALGVERTASHDEIRRAYKKLARKYHPDVSKEANAEARFKEVAEAHEALSDAERRAAYDEVCLRHEQGQAYQGSGRDGGFEFSGRGGAYDADDAHSDFFSSLFGHASRGERPRAARQRPGGDHHARVEIDLEDAYRGARRTLSLHMPVVDALGRAGLKERQLEVNFPKGVRDGQQLRLAGQGDPGVGGGPAGDLYLEVALRPHPQFRVQDRDVYVELPVSPWEAALGASVAAPTPEGVVELTIPAGSAQGRRLRLKGRGLPGSPPGDLYAVLGIALPLADSPSAQAAYAAMALAFPQFAPRAAASPRR